MSVLIQETTIQNKGCTRHFFQQIMDTLVNNDFAIAYFDILIMSENREQHAEYIKEIFEKNKQNGLKLSLDKWIFKI